MLNLSACANAWQVTHGPLQCIHTDAIIQDVNSKEHDQDTVAYKLSQAFGGVTIVQKGPVDLITNGKEGLLMLL